MKRYLKFFAALALGALALSACGNKDNPKDPEPVNLLDLLYPNGQELHGQEIKSTFMKQTMRYCIWLPPKFDAEAEYPILYLLHGAGDDQDAWLSDTINAFGGVQGGNAAEIAARYVKSNGVPMIIVMPDAQMTFYFGDFESYFYQELMPKVESDYKFNGKRAVAGLSMGGFGTLYHALKYPQKFTYAYSMSPASNYDTFAWLVDAQTDKSIFPAFTIEVGNQDGTVNNEETKKCADYMSSKGLQVEYIARDGQHEWGFWRVCLEKALKKVGESFK